MSILVNISNSYDQLLKRKKSYISNGEVFIMNYKKRIQVYLIQRNIYKNGIKFEF